MAAMVKEGCPYQGVLYAGLMITAQGPKVLEFNARFGDPEAQVIMPVIMGELLPWLEASVEGHLENCRVEMAAGGCVGVVLASGGYPGDYTRGQIIEGIEALEPDTMVFHAGTAMKDGSLVSNGGRVLAVVCRGRDTAEAIARVYREVEKIHFDGMHYRRDIGRRALQNEK